MKNLLFFACFMLLSVTLSFAQPHIETEGGSGGLDTKSILLGAVIGLVAGYLLGSRMSRK